MCISDYRLGLQIRTQLTSYSIGIGATQVIQPNPNRVGIMFATSTNLSVASTYAFITSGGVAVGRLWASIGLLKFLLTEVGDLCRKEFTVTAIGAAHVIGVVELFLPDDVIAAALSEFSRIK